ncbi:MAG: hypothetical protein ISR65_09115 [Bacteriovoracaceae bacterium]|nr:hypothetical protein [Bacteriovoracaceae bacterium]
MKQSSLVLITGLLFFLLSCGDGKSPGALHGTNWPLEGEQQISLAEAKNLMRAHSATLKKVQEGMSYLKTGSGMSVHSSRAQGEAQRTRIECNYNYKTTHTIVEVNGDKYLDLQKETSINVEAACKKYDELDEKTLYEKLISREIDTDIEGGLDQLPNVPSLQFYKGVFSGEQVIKAHLSVVGDQGKKAKITVLVSLNRSMLMNPMLSKANMGGVEQISSITPLKQVDPTSLDYSDLTVVPVKYSDSN